MAHANSRRSGEPAVPNEIWIMIGKHVIDDVRSVRIPSLYDFRDEEIEQPAITRVCRILRDELLPYYYETKVSFDFNVDVYEPEPDSAFEFKIPHIPSFMVEKREKAWLRAMGAHNRSKIRNARLWYHCSYVAKPTKSMAKIQRQMRNIEFQDRCNLVLETILFDRYQNSTVKRFLSAGQPRFLAYSTHRAARQDIVFLGEQEASQTGRHLDVSDKIVITR